MAPLPARGPAASADRWTASTSSTDPGPRPGRQPSSETTQTSSAATTSAIAIPTTNRRTRSPSVSTGRGCGSAAPAGEQLPRRLEARLGNQDVARAGGEEVGHVEAARAPLIARDPLLEQDALDQLRLGLVARERDLDRLPAGVLRADLARALVRRGDRLLPVAADVDERHLAVGAEALVERELARAGRAGERLDRVGPPQSTSSSISSTSPSSMRKPRTHRLVGPASEQISQSTPGHQRARLTSVCDGSGLAVRVRVEDRADLLPAGLDLVGDPDLIGGVDLKPHRARELVRRREVGGELAVGGGEHPAALVRAIGAGVGDQLVANLARDPHPPEAS